MADITAADVTYTVAPYPKGSRLFARSPRYDNVVTLEFGDGALTYPTNGIPLSGSGLGMPSNIVEVVIVFSQFGGANFWTYDQENNTLRAIVFSTGVEFSGAVPATTIEVVAIGY